MITKYSIRYSATAKLTDATFQVQTPQVLGQWNKADLGISWQSFGLSAQYHWWSRHGSRKEIKTIK